MISFSKPVKPEELEQAYADGMPRLEDLVDRAVYSGDCRNASKAVWSAQLGCFLYLRSKFGSSFFETIQHPAKDDGFDLFIPEARLDEPTPEGFDKEVASELELEAKRRAYNK